MKSWVEKQKEEKMGSYGACLSFLCQTSLRTLTSFSILTTVLPAKYSVPPTYWCSRSWRSFHCATCLLYFPLVKYPPRCKLTEVRPDFVFSPLCLSQSLASSLTLRNAELRSMVGTEWGWARAAGDQCSPLLAVISSWASVMRRLCSGYAPSTVPS